MDKIPIAILIGGGSKLPNLIKAARNPKSRFFINLVASHRANSAGIELAIKNKIPAIYFKLPDYQKRIFSEKSSKSRADYMKRLGWFISQREYNPALLVFAGWDLVMDKNFFDYFKCNFGNGYPAINLHPALLPINREGSKIKLPDGSFSPVIKGEQQQVLKEVIAKKLSYFGPTVHFMVPTKYDTGAVVNRAFIKVLPQDTLESLKKKLMPIEDKILVESINKVMSIHLPLNREQ